MQPDYEFFMTYNKDFSRTNKLNLIGFCLLLLLSFNSSAFSAVEVEPKVVSVTVSNVPTNVPSIFIPLNVSSQAVDLYKVELNEIFIRNYVASIEKDEKKKVVGISFASLHSKSLPETLQVNIKVKFDREALKTENEEKEKLQNLETSLSQNKEEAPKTTTVKKKKTEYPINATIMWQQPWAYTRPTKHLKDSFVGFDEMTLSSEDKDNTLREDKKRKRREQEDKDKDFYVKSLGQTIARGQRADRKEKLKDFNLAYLQELNVTVVTPPKEAVDKLYIPILVEEPQSIMIESKDSNWANNAIFRILNNNVLEVSSMSTEAKLPTGTALKGTLVIKQSSKKLTNKITLGSALSEPSESIAGIKVSITPSLIVIDNDSPLNIFKF